MLFANGTVKIARFAVVQIYCLSAQEHEPLVAHPSYVNGFGRSICQQQMNLASWELQQKRAGSVPFYVAFSLALYH